MLSVKDALELQIELNKKYDLKQFITNTNTCYRLSLPHGIYGENNTRIKNRSVELNGIVIKNVEYLVLNCIQEMLWFVCIDKEYNVVATKQISKNERLVVYETSSKTYRYKFC